MPTWIPGLTLSEAFYHEAVRPILDQHFPGVRHSAALIGWGSEVLGFDTPLSVDHEWGPRLLLFFAPEDFAQYEQPLEAALRQHLPLTFRGYSTHFGSASDDGVRRMEIIEHGPVDHKIATGPIALFFEWYLGIDPRNELTTADWLIFPQQRLRELTAGGVFHDGLGELNAIRDKLRWYPHDLWLYLLAAQWGRIGQEEAFVGRAGDVGDELGSAVVAARLVREVMRLCFLIEREYPPYSKWFGTGFARLRCAPQLTPVLQAVLAAQSWREREQQLVTAYAMVAELHNELAITPPLDPVGRPYYGRPYQVILASRFADALTRAIGNEQLRNLPPIGGVDQWVDAVDVLQHAEQYRKLTSMYKPGPG